MSRLLAAKRRYQPVTLFALSPQEQRQLEELSAALAFTTEGRRAQALLWLAAGQSTQTVAHRLRVSRQTVYNWMASFRSRSTEIDLPTRLADKHRSGRPRTLP
jgi:transposase